MDNRLRFALFAKFFKRTIDFSVMVCYDGKNKMSYYGRLVVN